MSKRAVLAVTSAIVLIVSVPSLAAPKPSAGKPCKTSQIGTVIGSLVCTKSGKSAVWRKSAPSSSLATTTTTVLDITKAPPGTVLYSENFDDPAKSTWAKQSLGGYTGDVVDGQFRMAAAPPAPGRVSSGTLLSYGPRVEVAFDMTLTPGALSKASPNFACQDTGASTGPLNFLLVDVRPDGRIAASRYDNAAATQQPTSFFDRGFSNQDRFDTALIHPRTRVAFRCVRDGANIAVVLSLDGKVVMDTVTPALGQAGDGFIFYMSTFSTGFRDPAELLIDNVVVTKV